MQSIASEWASMYECSLLLIGMDVRYRNLPCEVCENGRSPLISTSGFSPREGEVTEWVLSGSLGVVHTKHKLNLIHTTIKKAQV